MGRKSAHTGMSPKDRSAMIMDKFISKNIKREQGMPFKSGIRKDPNIPIHMWPLKDQIEYWETRTDADRFVEKYPVYSFWITEIKQLSKVHPTFFDAKMNKLKDLVTEMWESKTFPKEAVSILRKHGLY
jgi:hypothetical protein